jgi:hypothetical protein
MGNVLALIKVASQWRHHEGAGSAWDPKTKIGTSPAKQGRYVRDILKHVQAKGRIQDLQTIGQLGSTAPKDVVRAARKTLRAEGHPLIPRRDPPVRRSRLKSSYRSTRPPVEGVKPFRGFEHATRLRRPAVVPRVSKVAPPATPAGAPAGRATTSLSKMTQRPSAVSGVFKNMAGKGSKVVRGLMRLATRGRFG